MKKSGAVGNDHYYQVSLVINKMTLFNKDYQLGHMMVAGALA
jgi:hypothetical protein